VALEYRPDIFAGAVLSAGGGAGEIAVFNAKLDALWTLRTLTGAPLQLVRFDDAADVQTENATLASLVKQLRATPLGRARLALAAAFEQFPVWTDGDQPPASGDVEAQLDQIANAFPFGNPAQVRYGLERVGGGSVSWNHGVDYDALLAKSGMAPLVSALYGKTGGGQLETDLAALRTAPRLAADPPAVARVERLGSYTGKIAGPVIVVDNIGDPVDADAYKRAYEQTLQRAGTAALLRTTWVRSARHANLSPLERITAFSTLVERLDSGAWPGTSPEAMRARAVGIAAASPIDLGPSRFIDHQPPAPLRPWDGSNWGSYVPSQ
jgi:hypothetical protein